MLFGWCFYANYNSPNQIPRYIIEQDHRFVKKITKPMKGFKAFHSAEAPLSGIELHHMLRKGQHIQSGNQSIFEQFYGLAA